MRKTATLIFLFIFMILAAAGCQQPGRKTSGASVAEPLTNIYYIAGRLGMTVSSASKDKIVFNDGINTVTILPQSDQVFINKKFLAPLGRTKSINEMLNIRASLEDEIKNSLQKPVAEEPQIIQTPQKPVEKSIQAPSLRTIVIDAGHGGKDPGAISSYGYEEKTVNLDVALQIAQALRSRGMKVVTTRTNDVFLELEERADIANSSKADIFISIHSDSSEKSSKNGFTLYVERSGSLASTDLAYAIDKRMTRTGISSNGVRQADFRVLTHTGCPAVLIELGYLSNYREAKQLKDKDTQKELAQAVTDGIIDYIKR